ncbi:hypothetical protein [Tellurirhabdus bombi]|uniref:hypothetical protein n=1 Tax=Tellurirhabdus bombi TaxID=2907205 RepID=UPI001F4267E6|nr:hypothetical protein [Tellurirhabdus bombi]
MITESKDVALAHCLALIEEKLGWGNSSGWSSRDFELLSEHIAEQTNVTLSVTTLKRVWGKVKYESAPTQTTLDTLARFSGYDNWRAFRQHHFAATQLPQPTPENRPAPKKPQPFRRYGLAALVITPLLLMGYFWSNHNRPLPSAPIKPYQFSSQKVISEGVPNSVIFDYEATAAPTDSVFIQQSWDPSRRTQVAKEGHKHTSMYYKPGFFQAKLVVGNQVVKEHNLLITSAGWLPLIDVQPVPVYLKPSDVIQPDKMGLPLEKLAAYHVDLQPKTPWVSFFNVQQFKGVRSDQFEFESDVKNEYAEGSAACQQTRITLLTEGNAIVIPLSAKGCVSELGLMALDKMVSGKTTDLSAFGVDFSDWVKVRCEGDGQYLRFFVNDKLAYQLSSDSKASDLVGLVYHFQGTGSVRKIRLKSADRVVYQAF